MALNLAEKMLFISILYNKEYSYPQYLFETDCDFETSNDWSATFHCKYDPKPRYTVIRNFKGNTATFYRGADKVYTDIPIVDLRANLEVYFSKVKSDFEARGIRQSKMRSRNKLIVELWNSSLSLKENFEAFCKTKKVSYTAYYRVVRDFELKFKDGRRGESMKRERKYSKITDELKEALVSNFDPLVSITDNYKHFVELYPEYTKTAAAYRKTLILLEVFKPKKHTKK